METDKENVEDQRKCYKVDPAAYRILINPRLEGLPFSQFCSHFVFLCVIAINLYVAQYLSSTRISEVQFVVNSLEISKLADDANIIDCSNLIFETSFFHQADYDLFGAGTKIYLETRIKDLFSFDVEQILIPRNTLQILRARCNLDYELDLFCLEQVNEITEGENVYSPLYVSNILTSGVTPLFDSRTEAVFQLSGKSLTYHLTVGFDEDSMVLNLAILSGEVSDDMDMLINLLIIPVMSHVKNPIAELNRAAFRLIEALAEKDEPTSILRTALSKSFVTCTRKDSLSAFAYFGLLFDFAFFTEGFFTVFVAIFFLVLIRLKKWTQNTLLSFYDSHRFCSE